VTIERPMFPPRAGNSAFRVVGGSEFTPSDAEPPPPAPRKRKERAPYKERQPIEYQDGLPIIDPAGEGDEIFRHIQEHREAIIIATVA
jgi:hypothetical protein